MKTVEKLFAAGKNYLYCPACETLYRGTAHHSRHCTIRCERCLRMGYGYPDQCRNPNVDDHMSCTKCHATFQTRQCFDDHLREACQLYHFCTKCQRYYNYPVLKGLPHICEEHWCRRCLTIRPKKHKCMMSQKAPVGSVEYRALSFDIESDIVRKMLDADTYLHVANVVSVRVTCTRCMVDNEAQRWKDFEYAGCEICGPEKKKTFVEWDTYNAATGEWTYRDPMQDFIEWTLRSFNRNWITYAYSHNGSKYDMQFVLRELYNREGTPPKIITKGHKIMQIDARATKTTGRVVFRDTCLLFPMKLDDIPKTFNCTKEVRSFRQDETTV